MDYLRFVRDNAAWLAVGFLLAFSSSYGQTFFISIFSAEIMEAFNLTHGGWGLVYTIGTTVSAVIMVWAGGLADRFRVRVLAPVVLIGLALACVAMARLQAAWALPVVILALRFFGQGMSSQLNTVSMARWFVASRGRALAISAMGFAIGQALLPWGFVQLKPVADWRTLWLIAAAMSLATIPILLLLLRRERTPQSVAERNPVAGMEDRHWRRMDMIRHPLFWFTLPVIFGPAAWNTSLFFWQVHVAEVKGWAHADFVAIIPFFTLVSVVATFTSGWAIDRFGSGRPYVAMMAPQVLAFALMSLSDGLPAAWVAMALLAISAGSFATIPGSFAAEFYGTRYLGSIQAVWAALMVFGSAAGPGITGWLINKGMTYPDQMIWIAGYYAVATVALFIGVERFRMRG